MELPGEAPGPAGRRASKSGAGRHRRPRARRKPSAARAVLAGAVIFSTGPSRACLALFRRIRAR